VKTAANTVKTSRRKRTAIHAHRADRKRGSVQMIEDRAR
jgi:hypothetical protein